MTKTSKTFWQNLSQKQRVAVVLAIVLLAIVIIYSVFTLIFRAGKIATTVKFAPYNATITLNDSKIANNTTVWLLPGSYHLKVEFTNFTTIERDIVIDESHHYIVGTLEASNDSGNDYYNKHKEEFAETEGVIGQYLNEVGSATKEKYPILNYLPINNSLYSISYTYDEENPEPIITVKADPKYIDAAVGKLKTFKNVDLTAYQIVFNTENPYEDYQKLSMTDPIETIRRSISIIDDSYYNITEGNYIGSDYFAAQVYIYDYSIDYSYSHYIVLLKKNGNNWKIVNTPYPLLTTYNTPGVEKSILDSANSF